MIAWHICTLKKEGECVGDLSNPTFDLLPIHHNDKIINPSRIRDYRATSAKIVTQFPFPVHLRTSFLEKYEASTAFYLNYYEKIYMENIHISKQYKNRQRKKINKHVCYFGFLEIKNRRR
jgi:hypothetical protein